MVGSYSSTKCDCINWIVRADLPTPSSSQVELRAHARTLDRMTGSGLPPPPTMTSLYSRTKEDGFDIAFQVNRQRWEYGIEANGSSGKGKRIVAVHSYPNVGWLPFLYVAQQISSDPLTLWSWKGTIFSFCCSLSHKQRATTTTTPSPATSTPHLLSPLSPSFILLLSMYVRWNLELDVFPDCIL